MAENASVFAAELIKTLLHVVALTNMHRASGNDEYRRSAAGRLPTLDRQLSALRRELTSPKDQP